MNETQLLRTQIDTEHRHLAEIARLCARATGSGEARATRICVDYLLPLAERCGVRDAAHCARLERRLETPDPRRDTLRIARRAIEGTTAQAMRLQHTQDSTREQHDAARAFAAGLEQSWTERRNAIDPLLDASYDLTDWRATSSIDADAILHERTAYAQARQTLGERAAPAAGAAP